VRKSENRIIIIIVNIFRGLVNGLIYTGLGGGCVEAEGFTVSRRRKYRRKAMFSAAECAWLLDCHALPYFKKKFLFNSPCILSYGHNYKAIIIQQIAAEYIFFKSVNCSKYFGVYFTRHQEIITMCQYYVAFMRPLL